MKNNKYITIGIVVVFLIITSLLTYSRFTRAGETIRQDVSNSNLLINGDLDQIGFYWRPTNHWVAGSWFQWWGDYNAIPEYIDGGIPAHHTCYPKPPSGLCHDDYLKIYNSSQCIEKYGGAKFKAGLYKPVDNVFPCTLYTFEMWNKNDADSNYYHSK